MMNGLQPQDEATSMQLRGDSLRATSTVSTVGTREDFLSDVAAARGSGRAPVRGGEESDVLVGIVHPGVTGRHQHRERFTVHIPSMLVFGDQPTHTADGNRSRACPCPRRPA